MAYQEQISGIERLPDGRIAEYIHHDPDTGKPVSFDGHTNRGHPPVEVFLEAKDGYARLYHQPESTWSYDASRSLLLQTRRQIRALPDDAIMEWHVSDAHGARAIAGLFAQARIESDLRRLQPESLTACPPQ
jgi:hypothetical protein